MNRYPSKTPRNAFTLIEMMVVVAIIGLLLAALLPAFGTVRRKARMAQAKAMFNGLNQGILSFQTETSLGGALPPSTGDNPTEANRDLIANPKRKGGGQATVRVAGAHLLAHAMVGADGLGTPGFKDVDRDGLWSDDSHNDEKGVYELDVSTSATKFTRYGGEGYVDDKTRDRMKSLAQLEEDGVLLNLHAAESDIAKDELMFIDPWNMPVLYYRANRAALRMISSSGKSGVYRQEDNGIITGTVHGLADREGLDFGAGKVNGSYHDIQNADAPDRTTKPQEILEDSRFDQSFARFILNPNKTARSTPVHGDSYLLISAGPDARYGTDDDVLNWERQDRQ